MITWSLTHYSPVGALTLVFVNARPPSHAAPTPLFLSLRCMRPARTKAVRGALLSCGMHTAHAQISHGMERPSHEKCMATTQHGHLITRLHFTLQSGCCTPVSVSHPPSTLLQPDRYRFAFVLACRRAHASVARAHSALRNLTPQEAGSTLRRAEVARLTPSANASPTSHLHA